MHPYLRRESACPVHFLWDGLGLGRLFVRWGFLGFIITAMLALGGQMAGFDAPAWIGVLIAGALWTVGQVMSFAAAARIQSSR
jgi:hypothetical protein